MNQLNYIISLAANLAMAIIGAVLTVLGLINLTLTYLFVSFLEQEVAEGTTLNEALGDGESGALFDFASETETLIYMIGKLVIGGPLLFFGLRGLIRRIRDGVPDGTEDLPRQGEIKIGSVLVYGVGALVGFLLLVTRLSPFADEVRLLLAGETVVAVVEQDWRSDGSDGNVNGSRYVTYAFETVEGAAVSNTTMVTMSDASAYVLGGRVHVTYSPGDPTFNQPTHRVTPEDYLLWLLIYAAVMAGGIWGVMRNLGYTGANYEADETG